LSDFSKYTLTLNGDNIISKRKEIKEYFNNTCELYEKVFDLLKDDDVFYMQSEITRHPMIFYFGHTATFFVNKLINMKVINKRINSKFESIFAVGVDEMSWDDVDAKNYKWPDINEVRSYRKSVKEMVNKLIDTIDLSLPITFDSDMWIILMGIEHERIHIETSLVLHRQMPLEFIKDSEYFKICEHFDEAPTNLLIPYKTQDIKLGVDNTHNLYSWDNEYGTFEIRVEEFSSSKYLVSNGEFLEFVNDGGYEKLEYWDEEGLAFLNSSKVKYPSFWVQTSSGFKYRTLTKIIDMPLNWPVDVNALEAEAFCRYKSKKTKQNYSLISEAQHRVIYENSGLRDIPNLHESRANINFYHYASSSPVDEFAFNTQGEENIYDVIGNVWQWSSTPIRAFNGFKIHEAYDDFSIPTFDEKHALILGSSWASSGNLITKNSRYAFRKHFFQNAGFRYVVSENKNKEEKIDIYEKDELVSQYCEFQYGDTHFGVENFAIQTAKIASKFSNNFTKALDLGCATGRSSFELAKKFDFVEGIDFSSRFIGVGSKLKNEGKIEFDTIEEGELYTHKKVNIADLGYENISHKISFWQGDACNLKQNFNSFDLVLATNLIDRLYNPHLFLDSIDSRINKDGILVLTSPYTWQESSTKKEFWLGGYKDINNNEVKTLDSLKKILKDKFDLVHTQDVEFVIKETARKFQHSVSELSVWKKK
jgi:5-histidylcysteine sulfoxide synthase/putative 4-mercaptohistidine N1-methyltranferase